MSNSMINFIIGLKAHPCGYYHFIGMGEEWLVKIGFQGTKQI